MCQLQFNLDYQTVCDYSPAVAGATLTLVMWNLAGDWGHHGFHEYLIMGPLFFAVVGVVVFATALFPFLVVRWVAMTLPIRSIWYFLISGLATGLLLLPLAIVVIPPPGNEDISHQPSFSEMFTNAAPVFAMSGAIGALVYWWRTGRFLGQSTAGQSSD